MHKVTRISVKKSKLKDIERKIKKKHTYIKGIIVCLWSLSLRVDQVQKHFIRNRLHLKGG